MTLQEIQEQIDAKNSELIILKTQKEELENMPYVKYVGQYLRLSETCCVKVESIDHVNSDFVHINGIIAYCHEEYVRIEKEGEESFDKDSKPTVISESDFFEFLTTKSMNVISKIIKS